MTEPKDIVIRGLTKRFSTGLFKTKIGIQDFNLEIPRGEVVGLLGANGSGKSTTLKLILGFLKPTEGTIEVCGLPANSREARAKIGYLPENPRFQKFLTGRETLNYFGKLLSMRGKELQNRIDSVLETIHLKHAANERVQGYSKGMTQRLAIAQALLNRPGLLIFDEPMSGLDPLGRIEIRRLISQIHDQMQSTTIFFSSHILSDVEQLCSSVALLRKGKLEQFGKMTDLLRQETTQIEVVINGLPPNAEGSWIANRGAKKSPLGLQITSKSTEEFLDWISEIRAQGGKIVSLNSLKADLERALFKDSERSGLTEART